ncbi:hypothetical protein ACHAXT_005012 [Thalassiosira profunda]
MADPLEVITSPLWVFEPYLDVLSLVSLSKTCRPLRAVAVDAATGKIKSTEVVVRNHIRNRDGDIDWTLPEAMPHYVPRLVNAAHFPAIRRLVLGFPENVTRWKGELAVVPEASPAAFPMFAIQADKLRNLEELTIMVDALIPHEAGGALMSSYKIMGDNLAKAVRHSRKLKKLWILNRSAHDPADSHYSPGFLQAMVPVLEAGLLTLEDVTVFCGDYPSTLDYPSAGVDFFEAVLRLQNLKRLRVQIESHYGPLLGEFTRASRNVLGTLGRCPSADSLEFLDVRVRFQEWGGAPTAHRPPIAPFLSLFGDGAPALGILRLSLPPECWNASGTAEFIALLKCKSNSLQAVTVTFDGYKDETRHLLSHLMDFVHGRVSLPPHIQLNGLGCIEEQREAYEALGEYVTVYHHTPLAPQDGEEENTGPMRWEFLKDDLNLPRQE